MNKKNIRVPFRWTAKVFSFNRHSITDYNIAKQIFKDRAKIDVYDQIIYRWDDFLDFVWNYYHFRLERSK